MEKTIAAAWAAALLATLATPPVLGQESDDSPVAAPTDATAGGDGTESDPTLESPEAFSLIVEQAAAERLLAERDRLDRNGNIVTITSDQIRRRGYRTLSELLDSLNGILVTTDHVYDFVGVHGFGPPGSWNGRVLVLIDGHPLYEPAYGSSHVDRTSLVDMSNVERVDISLGTGETLWGNHALLAVVSVTTRPPPQNVELEGTGYVGDQNAVGIALNGGSRFGGQGSFRLSASAFHSSGTVTGQVPVADGGFQARRIDDSETVYRTYFQGRLGGVTLIGGLVHRNKRMPTGAYGTLATDPRNGVVDFQGFGELNYRLNVGRLATMLFRVGYDGYSSQGDYVTGDDAQRILNRDEATHHGLSAEVSARIEPRDSPHLHTSILLGLEGRADRVWLGNRDIQPAVTRLSTDRWLSSISVFGRSAHDIFRKRGNERVRVLSIAAGVRWDYQFQFGHFVDPRGSLDIPLWRNAQLQASAGYSYWLPTFYALRYTDGTTTKANPALDPERVVHVEGRLIQRLGPLGAVRLGGFWSRYDRVIDSVLDPQDELIQYRNLGRMSTGGLDVDLHLTPAKWLVLELGYEYQHSRMDGDEPANSPAHSGIGIAEFLLDLPGSAGHLSIALRTKVVGPRRALSGERTGTTFRGHATLQVRDILGRFDIALSAYNLIGKDLRDPAGPEYPTAFVDRSGIGFGLELRARL